MAAKLLRHGQQCKAGCAGTRCGASRSSHVGVGEWTWAGGRLEPAHRALWDEQVVCQGAGQGVVERWVGWVAGWQGHVAGRNQRKRPRRQRGGGLRCSRRDPGAHALTVGVGPEDVHGRFIQVFSIPAREAMADMELLGQWRLLGRLPSAWEVRTKRRVCRADQGSHVRAGRPVGTRR